MLPPIVNRFVAGTTVSEAIEYVETEYEEHQIKPIVNILGEHYQNRAQVNGDVETYCSLSVSLEESAVVDPTISVKPSQIGLDISTDVFAESLEEIVSNSPCRVWVDMESYETYRTTVDIVTELVESYPNQIGLCLQANIRETETVLKEEIAGLPMDVRLVKGAYSEPSSVAYQNQSEVDKAYKDCIRTAFEEFEGTETGLAVGTHHDEMISFARGLQAEYQLEQFEVQMLMGVRENRQRELAKDNVEMYQYVPFGSSWISYFYRRVREKKSNALFALRAVIGR